MCSVQNHGKILSEQNDKRDLWAKTRPNSRVWEEVWGCRGEETCAGDRDRAAEKERILPDPPRSTRSQFFQESVSRRQLLREAFISVMHSITAGLFLKSLVSVRLDEKDLNWTPPPPDQIRTLWAVTHPQSPHFSLKPREFLSTPIRHGNGSTASDATLRDQGSWSEDRQLYLRPLPWWWSVNKHLWRSGLIRGFRPGSWKKKKKKKQKLIEGKQIKKWLPGWLENNHRATQNNTVGITNRKWPHILFKLPTICCKAEASGPSFRRGNLTW